MSIIKEDAIGLYICAGGYITRPLGPTRFKVGDKIKSHHFGGTSTVGVGKDPTCKKGKYLETWTTTGIMAHEYDIKTDQELRDSYDWYLKHTKRYLGML